MSKTKLKKNELAILALNKKLSILEASKIEIQNGLDSYDERLSNIQQKFEILDDLVN